MRSSERRPNFDSPVPAICACWNPLSGLVASSEDGRRLFKFPRTSSALCQAVLFLHVGNLFSAEPKARQT